MREIDSKNVLIVHCKHSDTVPYTLNRALIHKELRQASKLTDTLHVEALDTRAIMH